MSTMRLLVLVFLTTFALPAYAQFSPYAGLTTSGDNNVEDVSAAGACWDNVSGTGCRDIFGQVCKEKAGCRLERVPAGRCSRGTDPTCVWPGGAGTCLPTDSNQRCITDSQCTTAGDTCDTSTVLASCACQGTNPAGADFETTVCGSGTGISASRGICSDGDPDAALGGAGTALCTDLVTTSSTFIACGAEAGIPLKGTPYSAENSPLTPVPQRGVGGAGVDTSPILNLETLTLLEFDAADVNGIKSFRTHGESYWGDWNFFNKALTGGAVSSTIVTYYCDFSDPSATERGPGDPITAGQCGGVGAACTTHQTCPGEQLCLNASFCNSSANAFDQPGFLYTMDAGSMGQPCPPRCGTTYDLHTLEQEELERVAQIERNVGLQLAFNNLSPPFAGTGDLIQAVDVISYTWIGETDLRCIVGGDTADPNFAAGKVGRCGGSQTVCNPDAAAPGCPGGEVCARCSTSELQAGQCVAGGGGSGNACQVNADCPAAETCDFAHAGPDGTAATANWPGDFDDGTTLAGKSYKWLNMNGRVGGLTLQGNSAFYPTLRVPLTLLNVTGDVAAVFRDNSEDKSGGGSDSADLGEVSGGSSGIGSGKTFTAGEPLPAFPGDSADALTPTFAENPGSPVNTLNRTYAWASGPDGIPGCVGDSSTVVGNGACNDIIGGANPGNTGSDDIAIDQAQIGNYKLGTYTGCTLTCVDGFGGPPYPARGTICNVQGAFCSDGVSVCMCAGEQAGYNFAEEVPNPSATFPTIRTMVAGTTRDLNVLAPTKDTDAVFKIRGVTCPVTGSCQTGGAVCDNDAECGGNGPCNLIKDCVDPVAAADCQGLGDTDGDGVCDDVDNCVFQRNPSQADSGGLNSAVPDGIGDACQCGDVSGNGITNLADAGQINVYIASNISNEQGRTPPTNGFRPDKCSTNNNRKCDSADVGRLNQAVADGGVTAIKQRCWAAQ